MSNIMDFRFYNYREKKMYEGFVGCSTTYVLSQWENQKHVSEPQQFIGVRDINKKKILVGDVVEGELSGEKYIGVCEYNSTLGCYIFGKEKKYIGGKTYVTVGRLRNKKVIGTIFDEESQEYVK